MNLFKTVTGLLLGFGLMLTGILSFHYWHFDGFACVAEFLIGFILALASLGYGDALGRILF